MNMLFKRMTDLEKDLYDYILKIYEYDKSRFVLMSLNIKDIRENKIYYTITYSNGTFMTGCTSSLDEEILHKHKIKIRKEKLNKICSKKEIE